MSEIVEVIQPVLVDDGGEIYLVFGDVLNFQPLLSRLCGG